MVAAGAGRYGVAGAVRSVRVHQSEVAGGSNIPGIARDLYF